MTLRVAITGASGQLGRKLNDAFRDDGAATLPLARPRFDLADPETWAVLGPWRPDVVINAAAWTDVDGCARDPATASALNGEAAGDLAATAAAVGALVLQVSTNEVFDGTLDRPYVESDPPAPINAYGQSKALAERLVAATTPRHLIVRTAWLFGPGSANFVTKILAAADRTLTSGAPLRVVGDEWGNPTATPWLAANIAALVQRAVIDDGELGIHHLVGQPPSSRAEWARRILAGSGTAIDEIASTDYERASRVPPRAVLASTRHQAEPTHDWASATDALVADILIGPT